MFYVTESHANDDTAIESMFLVSINSIIDSINFYYFITNVNVCRRVICTEHRVAARIHFTGASLRGHWLPLIVSKETNAPPPSLSLSRRVLLSAVHDIGIAVVTSSVLLLSLPAPQALWADERKSRTGTWPDIVGPRQSALLTPGSCLLRSFRSQSGMQSRLFSPSLGCVARVSSSREDVFARFRAAVMWPRTIRVKRPSNERVNKCFVTSSARSCRS